MKKILCFVVLGTMITISCNKNVSTPVEVNQKDNPISVNSTPQIMGGGSVVEVCTYYEVAAPTTYTGLTDPQTETNPGYGINENDNYDRGWKDGYTDALFYLNYYDFGSHAVLCIPTIKLIVRNINTLTDKLVNPGYVRDTTERFTGSTIVYPGCMPNWPYFKCVLQNQPESKSLRLQYEFNINYPGRTQAQIDYDKGRYMGFTTGINKQPYGIAP